MTDLRVCYAFANAENDILIRNKRRAKTGYMICLRVCYVFANAENDILMGTKSNRNRLAGPASNQFRLLFVATSTHS